MEEHNAATVESHHSVHVPEFYPGSITNIKFEKQTFLIECSNQVSIQLTILTDDIIRFRYGIDHVLESDFSYAVTKKFEPKVSSLETSETEDSFFIHTATLDIQLKGRILRFR